MGSICQSPANEAGVLEWTKKACRTRANCKYHIVFMPKYRRQIVYGANDLENHSLPSLPFDSEINRILYCFRHPMILSQPKSETRAKQHIPGEEEKPWNHLDSRAFCSIYMRRIDLFNVPQHFGQKCFHPYQKTPKPLRFRGSWRISRFENCGARRAALRLYSANLSPETHILLAIIGFPHS